MNITIAATSDIHLEVNDVTKDFFSQVNNRADLLLIAGDIGGEELVYTKRLLALLNDIKVPIVVVLGNHDHVNGDDSEIVDLLQTNSHITVLDGEYVEYTFRGLRIGVAGAKGYGGGFESGGEDRGIKKLMVAQSKLIKPTPGFILDLMHWEREDEALIKLNRALEDMKSAKPDASIVATHWAPFEETVIGENPDYYPLFGSSKLGAAIAQVKPNLSISGHAHKGPAGIVQAKESSVIACNVGYKVNDGKLLFFTFEPGKEIVLEY